MTTSIKIAFLCGVLAGWVGLYVHPWAALPMTVAAFCLAYQGAQRLGEVRR